MAKQSQDVGKLFLVAIIPNCRLIRSSLISELNGCLLFLNYSGMVSGFGALVWGILVAQGV